MSGRLYRRLYRIVDWDLQGLETLAREGSQYLRARSEESKYENEGIFTDDGRLSESGALDAAAQLAIIAAFQHLNTVVDSFILTALSHARPEEERLTQTDITRSRNDLLRELEKRSGVQGRSVAGWNGVDRLREEVNAVKHRSGILLITPQTITIGDELVTFNRMDSVKPTVELLEARVLAVRTWVREFVGQLEAAQPNSA